MTTTPASPDPLITYRKQHDTLISYIDRQLLVLGTLKMDALREDLYQLRERVCADNFKILVMGEFKRGKSTFINAMLRKKVLPAFVTPTTAIITEVKWGKKPRAILHLRPQGRGTGPLSSGPLSSRGSGMAQEVPVDKIKQYVVIDHVDSSRQQSYEKMEIFWPLDICRNGVEVIDSPGLNEQVERQQITMNYLATADAVIFVVLCTALGSITEMDTLSGLQHIGKDNIFFVCTKIDTVPPEEMKKTKNYCIKKLSQYTKQGAQSIFFLNALGALEARIQGDSNAEQQSGILPLEAALKSFLVNERGSVKIEQPAKELRVFLSAAREVIPTMEKLYHESLETIRTRYEKKRKDLEQLEQERKVIVQRFANFRADVRTGVRKLARDFFLEVADRVPKWSKEYNATNKVALTQIFSREVQEKLSHEVVQFLAGKLSEELKVWQDKVLLPELTRRLDSLKQELDSSMSRFFTGLDQVYLDLLSGTNVKESLSVAALLTSVGREEGAGILAVAGSLAGAAATIAPVALPLVLALVPLAVLWGWVINDSIKEAVTEKTQEIIGKQYREELLKSCDNLAESLAEGVDVQLGDLQEMLNRALGLELQKLRDQVNAVINEKEHGQARVNQALRELTTISGELDALDVAIDTLIQNFNG